MKKINLRGLQEKLSPKELKNILGGSGATICGDITIKINVQKNLVQIQEENVPGLKSGVNVSALQPVCDNL